MLSAVGAAALVVKAATDSKPAPDVPSTFGSIEALGREVFTSKVVPFELTGALLLVAVSLGVSVLGLAGTAYAIAASLLGGGFMALAALGLRSTVRAGWARQAFAYSLIYLPLLIGVLVIDAR